MITTIWGSFQGRKKCFVCESCHKDWSLKVGKKRFHWNGLIIGRSCTGPFLEIGFTTLNRRVCGVMGRTPRTHLSQSGCTVMSGGFRCTWVRSDSGTPEWPKFGPTVPFSTPGVMTQGGGCHGLTEQSVGLPQHCCKDSRVEKSCYSFNFDFCIPFGVFDFLVK